MAETRLESDRPDQHGQEPLRNGETPHNEPDDAFPLARLGIWVFFVSLIMWFGALAVLYVLRAPDRANFFFEPPGLLWASTAAILLSSVTAQFGLRGIRRGDERSLDRNLTLTFAIGLIFISTQTLAWLELARQGVYAQANLFSGMFFVMTGLHAAHVLVGIAWIGWLLYLTKARVYSQGRYLGVELGIMYWHFMAAVWIVFFLLLMFI